MSMAPAFPICRHQKRRKRVNQEVSQTCSADTGNVLQPPVKFDSIDVMDASEYLSRVGREAKSMPDIFVAAPPTNKYKLMSKTLEKNNHIPIEGSAASLSYLLSGRASLKPPPTKMHLPANVEDIQQWTKVVLTNFETLRLYLEKCKAQGIGGKETDRIPLPPMKDRLSWHTFCVGESNANRNSELHSKDDTDDTIQGDGMEEDEESTKRRNNVKGSLVESRKTPTNWREQLPEEGYQPIVRLLLQMDQVMIRCVLSHFAHNHDFETALDAGKRAEWIYSLLARLEKPIHRDDAAMLFDLLRDLCLTRSEIGIKDVDNLTYDWTFQDCSIISQLNVLITVIGIYFEQGGSIDRIFEWI